MISMCFRPRVYDMRAQACVLKEYKLDNADEWKALAKEVQLLGQLAHCPYIADVQAVFVTHEPTYAAFPPTPAHPHPLRTRI